MSLEIGSDFSLAIPAVHSFNYYKAFHTFFTGRGCIQYMIKNTMGPYLIPEYICCSILHEFEQTKYVTYKVHENLHINYEDITEKLSTRTFNTIFMIDFFGTVDPNITNILDLCKRNSVIVVEDFTHRPFSIDTLYGDINLCSIRKSLPTPYGGILNGIEAAEQYSYPYFLYYIKMIGMGLKHIRMLKPIWRPMLIWCENYLDSIQDTCIDNDWLTRQWLTRFDCQQIKEIRKRNYQHLDKHLHELALIKDPKELYFFYPLVLENNHQRNRLKDRLVKNGVYPPIHWPDQVRRKNNILSLPIDQRYTLKDMDRIIRIVLENS